MYERFEAEAARGKAVFPANSEKRANTGELECLLEQVEAQLEIRERRKRRARRAVIGNDEDAMDLD